MNLGELRSQVSKKNGPYIVPHLGSNELRPRSRQKILKTPCASPAAASESGASCPEIANPVGRPLCKVSPQGVGLMMAAACLWDISM